ncbi:MAG: LolA family protein [Gemmatimonadota bacterium]
MKPRPHRGAIFHALAAALVLAAGTAARPAAAQDGPAVVGRSAQVYQRLTSLTADFDQVIEDRMLGEMKSKGKLVQAGTSRLAMRFSDPDGDAIVADGRYLWVYTPSTTPGQVLRLNLPSTPVYGVNVLSWLLDKPAERYRSTLLRTERIDGRLADVVELIPTVPDLPFTRALVWLDRGDALPRRLEINERTGLKRTISLHRIRTNQNVSPGTFKFTVPKDVRVVDHG